MLFPTCDISNLCFAFLSSTVTMYGGSVSGSVEDMKRKANLLYARKMFAPAKDLYTRILRDIADSEKGNTDLSCTIRCNRAACYIELGEYPRAVLDLSPVVGPAHTGLLSLYAKAYYRLSRAFLEMGHAEEARRHFDNYVRMAGATASNDPAAKELQRKIHERAGRSNPLMRPIMYQVRVLTKEAGEEEFVKEEFVPAELCAADPPKDRTIELLKYLLRKYDKEVRDSRPWKCWNCGRPANSITHTPSSFLHHPVPLVIDFSQPVCMNSGPCDMAGRELVHNVLSSGRR
ncbi:hypothetical protein D9613_009381 [Agrocybe pediades]|uniref:Uncharacterized protein n=1 Tax=Agrocybe pediades TaxID=84607 RepID=A0A8H4R3J8_9AGAR|nr:hypothetical protein D9613_009381 [Agrocybe pediades]